MYDKAQVPYYLIAYGDSESVKEILTEYEITTKYPSALGIRIVSKEVAEKYYVDTNYKNKICSYVNYIDNNCENPFIDTYEIECYLEGKLEEQDIKGVFKGKIKIKKYNIKR